MAASTGEVPLTTIYWGIIITDIGHGRVWVNKESRGILDINVGFFTPWRPVEPKAWIPEGGVPKKRRKEYPKAAHRYESLRYKEKRLPHRTNSQKRQLYGGCVWKTKR